VAGRLSGLTDQRVNPPHILINPAALITHQVWDSMLFSSALPPAPALD